jgi:phosphatidylserine decarboxylase
LLATAARGLPKGSCRRLVEATGSRGRSGAIILIEADDPVIGLIAFVSVGMLVLPPRAKERSSATSSSAARCTLVFRLGAIAEFDVAATPKPLDPEAPLVPGAVGLATANTAD